MTAHSEASLGGRHPIHNWEYANETARLAATGFVSSDIGKVALQQDNGTYWTLNDDSPITWASLEGTGLASHIADTANPHSVTAAQAGATPSSHASDTGNPHSVTKAQVGLTNVPDLDTTNAVSNEHTHSNKAELDQVSDGNHDARTDNPHSTTAAQVGATPSSHASDTGNPHSVTAAQAGATPSSHATDTGNPHSVTAAQAGATPSSHATDTGNPHSVTKAQVGLTDVPDLDTTSAVSNEHTHSNKTQLDLVTDGDHDARTDNPHSATAAQVGAIPSPIAATLDMNNNQITEIKTATFNSVPTVTPSAGTMVCAFDDYQKIIGNLNNVASVTIQLNVPNGPGNYMLVLLQGGSTPSSITWATEGTHALYAPGGAVEVQGGAGDRTIIGLFYDGSAWYVTPSPVSQVLAT